jgi:hypothetical protein
MSRNSSWADGTERLIPASRMARFIWNGKTLDIPDPLRAITYEDTPIVGANTTASGLREVLHERNEEVCILSLEELVPEIFGRLQRMLREWAGRGEQLEVYIDRQLRAYWGFEDGDAYDNNRGNAFRASDAISYAELTRGGGVTMPSSGTLQASLVCALPGGSGNFFFSKDEGTLVLLLRPDYANTDGAEHVWVDCVVAGDGGWRNRLSIIKRGNDTSSGNDDNEVIVSYVGSNGSETVISAPHAWSSGDELVVQVQWKALTDLRLRINDTVYTTKKYPIVSGGATAGAGTISGTLGGTPNGSEAVMDASPTRISLGTEDTGLLGRGTGVYGALSFYTVAYGTPDILKTFAHPMRTYYPRGEFIDAGFRPLRSAAAGELYYYTLRIRDGR